MDIDNSKRWKQIYLPLWLRKVVGYIFKVLTPGFVYCYRCQRPYSIAKHHTTKYSENRGFCPLCEMCWQELDPKDSLPYYRKAFFEGQISDYPEEKKWENVKEAVLQGK